MCEVMCGTVVVAGTEHSCLSALPQNIYIWLKFRLRFQTIYGLSHVMIEGVGIGKDTSPLYVFTDFYITVCACLGWGITSPNSDPSFAFSQIGFTALVVVNPKLNQEAGGGGGGGGVLMPSDGDRESPHKIMSIGLSKNTCVCVHTLVVKDQ